METPFSSPVLAGSGKALRRRKVCVTQVGSSVLTAQLPSARMGTHLGGSSGMQNSPMEGAEGVLPNLQGCKDIIPCPISDQEVGVVEVRGVFWEVGPQIAQKFLLAVAAPSLNEVLVFDHPGPNRS